MLHKYKEVTTRFLRDEERLILSQEKEMPLVLEAKTHHDVSFLQTFLANHSKYIIQDIAEYGAVLLRGFTITTDKQFESIILSIPEFRGIKEAFMAENGRTHVDNLEYVLNTNSVYKTGGTLYLGGFHTENYYSTDVPGYIFFYCAKPPALGGETGLINTQKIYEHLDPLLQQKIEKNSFYVAKWLVSEIAERYGISQERVEEIAAEFNLPIIGSGHERFVAMYKPCVFIHPLTQEKSLQVNLFELSALNHYLRKCFKSDYKGKEWFWHRFLWSLPSPVFNTLEYLAIATIAFTHSPQKSYKILQTKLAHFWADKSTKPMMDKVGTCFNSEDIKKLAQSMRDNYCSCLWQKGDILLVDNRKVMHAGMPGKGERTIRAMISNPIAMNYSFQQSGLLYANERKTSGVGEQIIAQS